MRSSQSWANFPGADLVADGMRDLRSGSRTVPALLVSLGETRLRAAGIDVPEHGPMTERASHALYGLLAEGDPRSAHSQYNALVGRLVSFARAAEHAHNG